MEFELPKEFDLIVVGTGLVESVISAAASRIGKRVLHIDSNNYYGGFWASFNLESFQRISSKDESTLCQQPSSLEIQPGERYYNAENNIEIENISREWSVPDKCKETKIGQHTEHTEKLRRHSKEKSKYTKEQMLEDSRKFNIDLAPKLQFARGQFVELLISSNIARYSEFRSVSRVLTYLNGQLEVVPCSRSDVFTNNKVSVIEKRMLMKLLTSIDEDINDTSGYANKTFKEVLKDKKLTPNLIHYVLYALSMSTDTTPYEEGLRSTKRFLDSLGRFGKTPFLFSMYGSGEIPQAFCRLSAVFGGIYALNQPLGGYLFDKKNRFHSIVCGNQRIKAPQIVMSAEKAPKDFVKWTRNNYISRGVFITDKSILSSEREHLTLLIYPPENGKPSCYVLELGTLSGTCPKDFFIVHMISKQTDNPKEDLAHCVHNLFEGEINSEDETKPKVLYSCFFSLPDTNDIELEKNIPSNVFLCPGPDIDLDYDFSIKKAKDIFARMYPNEEFLPRAPDPEEIIIDDDTEEDEIPKGSGEVVIDQKTFQESEKENPDVEHPEQCQENGNKTEGTSD